MAAVITSLDFESIYLETRQKENRIYSDEQVAQLPSIEPEHPHAHEWQVRKRSAERLIKYLEKKNKPLTILEMGCGNGWLSAKIAKIPRVHVTGIDINTTELSQAKRMFGQMDKLEFAGDPKDVQAKPDIIIFAASIQYFPSFEDIINQSLQKLKPGGEIHIIDSMFYPQLEIKAAAKRSAEYYQAMGAAEMTNFYFHHSMKCLEKFHATVLYDPASLLNKLRGKRDPFPWFVITP